MMIPALKNYKQQKEHTIIIKNMKEITWGVGNMREALRLPKGKDFNE